MVVAPQRTTGCYSFAFLRDSYLTHIYTTNTDFSKRYRHKMHNMVQ